MMLSAGASLLALVLETLLFAIASILFGRPGRKPRGLLVRTSRA